MKRSVDNQQSKTITMEPKPNDSSPQNPTNKSSSTVLLVI